MLIGSSNVFFFSSSEVQICDLVNCEKMFLFIYFILYVQKYKVMMTTIRALLFRTDRENVVLRDMPVNIKALIKKNLLWIM